MIGHKGAWRITTQGSVHIWNLDDMTWVRQQVDGLNPMAKDGKPVHLIEVVRWPEVGGTFYVLCSERPQAMRHEWHQSSTIRAIEEVVSGRSTKV